MAGHDLDISFVPRKLLSSATSSSSSGTQCKDGADPARHALCGCRPLADHRHRHRQAPRWATAASATTLVAPLSHRRHPRHRLRFVHLVRLRRPHMTEVSGRAQIMLYGVAEAEGRVVI